MLNCFHVLDNFGQLMDHELREPEYVRVLTGSRLSQFQPGLPSVSSWLISASVGLYHTMPLTIVGEGITVSGERGEYAS